VLTVINERGNDLRFGPLSFWIEFFSEAIPTAIVSDGYLCEVVFQNGLMEVDDKLGEGKKKVIQKLDWCDSDSVFTRQYALASPHLESAQTLLAAPSGVVRQRG